MSKMGEKVLEVQDLIREFPEMYLEDIAKIAGVSVDFVQDVESVMYDEEYDAEPDDGYALASAGFGTDEDYGYYGDD